MKKGTESMVPSQLMIVLPDDCRIHVERRGVGRPVLLIHAGSEDSSLWSAQAEALAARGFEAIAYDRRGTGRSDKIGWPADGAAGHARDAAEVIRALRLSDVWVLGVSMGAIIALQLGASSPDLVSAVFAHEPPLFRHFRNGDTEFAELNGVIQDSLLKHPGDYAQAYEASLNGSEGEGAADAMPAWRLAQEKSNARSFIIDDLPLTSQHQFKPDDFLDVPWSGHITSGTDTIPFLITAAASVAELGGWDHQQLAEVGHTPHIDDPQVLADLLEHASRG